MVITAGYQRSRASKLLKAPDLDGLLHPEELQGDLLGLLLVEAVGPRHAGPERLDLCVSNSEIELFF